MNWLKSFWKALTTPMPREGHEFLESMNNFTPWAQQVLALARKEAARLNHNFVGTEHLLLGLIKFGRGVAVNALGGMGLDLKTVRLEVEKQVGPGPDQKQSWPIPYTPRVKKVLLLAVSEARALNHTYVGTEHILLGLLREGDGVAPRVLQNLGVSIEKTRQQILQELDPNFSPMGSDVLGSQDAESPNSTSDTIDITKRYDVYCSERNQEVVYRNTLFKGRKKLFQNSQNDSFSEFVELEQEDGQTIFVAKAAVMKFCEHGVTPASEKA
jgi:ATP-dependent Clp protease ATP-binding subunit ClpA